MKAENKLPPRDCEHCVYLCYDEETDAELCDLSLDEDDEMRMLTAGEAHCPFFRLYDEYGTVRKQN